MDILPDEKVCNKCMRQMKMYATPSHFCIHALIQLDHLDEQKCKSKKEGTDICYPAANTNSTKDMLTHYLPRLKCIQDITYCNINVN